MSTQSINMDGASNGLQTKKGLRKADDFRAADGKGYHQREEGIFKLFADLTDDAFVLLDSSAFINYCNGSAVRLFGFECESDLIGKSFYGFMPEKGREPMQSKIVEGLQQNSEFRGEVEFCNANGVAFHANLRLSTNCNADNCIAAIIRDTSPFRKAQADADAQIEVFARLSIFNYEIKQAKTCKELTQSLCSQSLLLTEADEAWVLSNDSKGQLELVYCDKQLNQTLYLDVDIGLKTRVLNFLYTPQDVYAFENTNIVRLLGFKIGGDVVSQFIIGTRLRSGNWTLLGLNYHVSVDMEKHGDLAFLRNIFSQVFSTFENLSTYESLIANENRFRAIIEGSDNVICILNSDLVFTYVSPAIKNYLYVTSDFIGKRAGNFTHPDDQQLYLDALQKVFLDATQTVNIPCIRHLRKDGAVSFSSIDITNMMHVNGVEGLVISIRDINERIQYEVKLRQSEEKFRNIFNSGNDPVYIADLQGNFIEINDMAVARTGFSKEEFLQTQLQRFSDAIPEDRANTFIAEIIKEGYASTEEFYFSKEGSKVFFNISGKLIDYNNRKAILLRTINITDRVNTERQILDAVIKTEESERARFARELHDGIGPYLSAIKFFLQTLSRENDGDTRVAINNKALESIDEIIRNIKEISNNISPRVLSHFGIIPAINTIVKKITDKHVDISIDSNIEGVRFNENMEINIFRIYTELINNSLKHSKAKRLAISLKKEDNLLVAAYSDNGVGFDYNKKFALGRGSGLYNIANRVNSLNGTFDFETRHNKGVLFKAIFEIKK